MVYTDLKYKRWWGDIKLALYPIHGKIISINIHKSEGKHGRKKRIVIRIRSEST